MTEGIMPVPQMVGHVSVTFGSAWVEPIDTKRVLVWRFAALAKVEDLRELKQLQGHTMDLVEV
jgi:hypothetical protein